MPSCPGLRVVLPTAPADHQLVTQWFDEPTKESLKIGRERVEQIIKDEVARLGDPTRIFLGGSSQGCILGLDCYMRSPYELGGFCGIVGYWPLCSTPVLQDVKMSKVTRGPVYLLNGTEDKIVDLQEARDSYKVLRKSGLKSIHTEEWPERHDMGQKEGKWIRAFVKTVSLDSSPSLAGRKGWSERCSRTLENQLLQCFSFKGVFPSKRWWLLKMTMIAEDDFRITMLLIHLKFLKIAEQSGGPWWETFGPGIERIFLWCRSGLELFVCLKLWSWPLVSIYYMSIGRLLYLDVSFKRLCWQEAFLLHLHIFFCEVIIKSFASLTVLGPKSAVKAGLSYSLDASGTGAVWMVWWFDCLMDGPIEFWGPRNSTCNAASPQHRSRFFIDPTKIKWHSNKIQFWPESNVHQLFFSPPNKHLHDFDFNPWVFPFGSRPHLIGCWFQW